MYHRNKSKSAHLVKAPSHFVHCEAVVFFLQSLLCVLEGLEDQLLLPLGLHAGQL